MSTAAVANAHSSRRLPVPANGALLHTLASVESEVWRRTWASPNTTIAGEDEDSDGESCCPGDVTSTLSLRPASSSESSECPFLIAVSVLDLTLHPFP